jgi:hypothetical protein
MNKRTPIWLKDIFARKDHDYEMIHRVVRRKLRNTLAEEVRIINKTKGKMATIDLGGRIFVLDRPLELNFLNLVRLVNGTLIAGPDFPEDEFLISVKGVHGVELRHLMLECSKRASGIRFEDFMRVRVEDCYIIHQTRFGIYSSPTGNNHELEIFKCHISEFLFGDGYPKKEVNYGVIPPFDVDENRQSTGIFLGQADNVVADCNINLCRVGIFSGMRANRIHGNHITGGGSKKLEIFKGIELNNFHKSSAMIVNNYIDNCCLWINCTADESTNLRNYIHVTDNLFYRGYNHPLEGDEEFHHIVINPLEPNSLIANLHIRDNLFYNQPENLNGIKPRIITPVHVRKGKAMKPVSGEWTELIRQPGMPLELKEDTETNIDHRRVQGISIGNNHFTNDYPTFVVPMGTTVIKEIEITPGKELYRVSFDMQIPLGVIQRAKLETVSFEGKEPPRLSIKSIHARSVMIFAQAEVRAKVQVEVSTEGRYSKRFDYIVK